MSIEGNETAILNPEQHPLNEASCAKVHKCAVMMVMRMHEHIQHKHLNI